MKQKLITLFAIVGLIVISLKAVNYFRHQAITSQYWENCKKVKPGMNLTKARTIIGDINYQSWTQDDESGEIIVHSQTDGTVEYSLEYDMVFGGSDNPKIYFDPNTLIVTKVFSGE